MNQVIRVASKRHFFLTIWLYLVFVIRLPIILICGIKLIQLAIEGNFTEGSLPIPYSAIRLPSGTIILLLIDSLIIVYFAIMLLRWRKFGYWGFVTSYITSRVTLLTAGLINGSSMGLPTLELIYLIVLFVALKLKKDGVSAWECLE